MNLSDADVQRVLAEVCAARGRRCPTLIMENNWPNLASVTGDTVTVGRNLISMLDSEDELAAVLGHELSHRAGDGFQEWDTYMTFGPRVAWETHMLIEKRADRGSVDLLRKMGRDPSAALTMLQKIDEGTRFPNSDTADGSRARNVEQYIADTK